MKTGKKVFFLVGALLIAACICLLVWIIPRNNINVVFPEDTPSEVKDVITETVSIWNRSTVEYYEAAYWLDPDLRADGIQNVRSAEKEKSIKSRLLEYEIESIDKVNDSLYAITALTRLKGDAPGAFYRVYHFVLNVDGKFQYAGNKRDIPESLKENFNPEKYQYTGSLE